MACFIGRVMFHFCFKKFDLVLVHLYIYILHICFVGAVAVAVAFSLRIGYCLFYILVFACCVEFFVFLFCILFSNTIRHELLFSCNSCSGSNSCYSPSRCSCCRSSPSTLLILVVFMPMPVCCCVSVMLRLPMFCWCQFHVIARYFTFTLHHSLVRKHLCVQDSLAIGTTGIAESLEKLSHHHVSHFYSVVRAFLPRTMSCWAGVAGT